MSTQRVTAILVVHDGATWLPQVVTSLATQTRGADRIIAVDTGSLDASAKLLKGARIPTISLDREIGFGEAISFAVGQLPPTTDPLNEWIWVLHDDCAFAKDALENLLTAVSERPNVAMAGPKLLGWHDRTHLLEVGISLATNGARWTGLEQAEYDQGQRDGVHEVLAVSTAGALIRRDVYEELGGYDKNLELFRDDVDFGWRARVAGHSVIVATDAVGYHAQAAASERRTVDVKGALLHRPLLLDRRNAAYVLLANASMWALPVLSLQLLAGALFRSAGYLFAKLPGYASDELLAILTLIIHPTEILTARKTRKKSRFISSAAVKPFIPSRFQQIRSSVARAVDALRERVIPDREETVINSALEINEDEDLLTPSSQRSWLLLFTRPIIAMASVLVVITLLWSRHRFGAISGGALAMAPESAQVLFKLYIASWHDIGMGSGLSTPVWVPIVGVASFLTFGNVAAFISLFFLLAPFALLFAAHRYLKSFTENSWLAAGAALFYALSPVAISAVNSGRLGLLLFLILLPFTLPLLKNWAEIHTWKVRRISAIALLIGLLSAFNPSVILVLLGVVAYSATRDFLAANKNFKDTLFLKRAARYATLLLAPILLSAPSSFEFFMRPQLLMTEIGFTVAGGGPNLAIIGNPGGPGSLPWWSISPITVVLLVTYFSSTAARKFATPGVVFLLSGALVSALVISGNGSSSTTRASAGVFIAVATLFAIAAAVIMFDKIKSRLEQSHVNYRHISIALVLLLTVGYTATSTFWLATAGSDSPVRTTQTEILPAFLAIEKGAKTVVIRPYRQKGEQTLAYYISRGREVTLGEPDIAPRDTAIISRAIEGLVDNTGVTSSNILSTYGIKYVFLKSPVSQDVVQTIDGLGGFSRTSATEAGIVWKVLKDTGRIKFTNYSGREYVLESKGVRAFVPAPGALLLAETYSDSWQVFQNGYRLAKVEDANGLPTFEVTEAGEISIVHDGRARRAWISVFIIAIVTLIVLALPGGRRKAEISDKEIA
uniref:glycosyltransferase family 2 protein n=1 Tax=Candidatus Planktophila sp. TaxID=2175601 RepID=UPI00404B8D0E